MAENKAKVIYDNVLRAADTVTWAGTTVFGKDPQNAWDWRNWSIFETGSSLSSVDLDFTFLDDKTFDSFSIYVMNYTGTGSETIELYYETSPSSFTLLNTRSSSGGELTLKSFSEVTLTAGLRLRISFTTGTATLNVRQLVVGKLLEFERGQWNGVMSPNFSQGSIGDTIISVNGDVIAKNFVRITRKTEINLSEVSESWVREFWAPFQEAVETKAFIYQWSPVNYPDEVAMAAPDKTRVAETIRGNRMSVIMPITCNIADSNVI